MQKDGRTPEFPPIPTRYLVDWFFEIGPSSPGGMAGATLTWSEMEAWQRLTGISLEAWEARTIREMSRAFLKQQHDSRKANCPAPWSESPEVVNDRVTAQFAAMFKAMAKDGKGR
jgi:broad specificity phosphatase PhoE